MLIKIIDLCGRAEPHVVDPESADLTNDDLDHIFDMWADGRPAYIGEFEYQEFA